MKCLVVFWQRNHDNILKMFKTILVSCLFLAVAQAELARNDDYINLNHFQYQKVIEGYDIELVHFEELYTGRVETAVVQSKLTTDALAQNDERLNPFVLLGDYFKRCVLKYRPGLPTIQVTQKALATCELQATKELTVLLSVPRNTRNDLENYIKNTYEKNLKECGEEYGYSSSNYTLCVTSVTALANSYTTANQKLFSTQLEAAVCTAKANIKVLLDCAFTEQSRVTTLISEINVLIKHCLEGKDDCKPCEAYTCSESFDLEINNKSETIKNPFLGRENHNGCLMLNGKKY